MDIIQIQTIIAWKGAQERSGKPCSFYLAHSHDFYKEWADISRKCVAIVNHKRVVYWVNNYTKNEIHGWKTWRLAWCHGMTSPCLGKKIEKVWLMLSCTPFMNRTITEEVPCFRKGNPQDWRGIQIFFVLCPGFFSTMNIHPANHRVQIWHFSGLIYHI